MLSFSFLFCCGQKFLPAFLFLLVKRQRICYSKKANGSFVRSLWNKNMQVIRLKKTGCALLAVLLCFALSFSASAENLTQTVPVGGILIPITFSDSWYCSTPGDIQEDLQEKRSLSASLLTDYMNAFSYCMWLTEKRGEKSIIVTAQQADGQESYASLTAAQLNQLLREQVENAVSLEGFSVEAVERYHSGSVLFIKYTVLFEEELYAYYYHTVTNGLALEVRFLAEGEAASDDELLDLQSVVDSLGTAMTFPEQYETAPATTTPETTTGGSVSIDLEGGEGDGVLHIGGGEPSATAPDAPTQTDDTGEQTTEQPLANPDILEFGTDGQTLVIGEAETISSQEASGNTVQFWVIFAILAAGLVTIIAVSTKRKYK